MLKSILCATLLVNPVILPSGGVFADHAPRAVQVAKSHDGKVVSVGEAKLVVSDSDGKNEHTHEITGAAKITLGGKLVKLTELKKGDAVKVTMVEGVVTMIDATRPTA